MCAKQIQTTRFFEFNYAPVLDLFDTDYIASRTNYQDYIPFGDDNALPRQLIKLAREVPVHRAILNSKTNYIIGQGIQSSDPVTSAFINLSNNIREPFLYTLKKLCFDFLTFGNCYYELVSNSKRSFVFVYHQDASRVRLHVDGKQVLIHPCWDLIKGKDDKDLQTIALFPEFSKGSDGLLHSVVQIKDYEPEFFYYGIPSYFAGIRNVIISGLTNIWNQTRLESSFATPGLLVIPGVNSDEAADELDAMFQQYKGALSSKANEIIIQYLSDLGPGISSQEAKFISFNRDKEDNWTSLHKQSEISLITIHNWFRTLTPYSDEKAGFDSGRILNEYDIAISTVIHPIQEVFIQSLETSLSDCNLQFKDFEFINTPPISRINPMKYVWEIRRDTGLDYDKTDPVQKLLVLQLKNIYPSSDTLNI